MDKNVFLESRAEVLNIRCSECSRAFSILGPPVTPRKKWYCPWCGQLLKREEAPKRADRDIKMTF